MKDLTELSFKIKYEDIFEKELIAYAICSSRYKADIYFKCNNHYFIINDDLTFYKQYNLWLIVAPFHKTYENLNYYKVQYFMYKDLIYGFFKHITENKNIKVLTIS